MLRVLLIPFIGLGAILLLTGHFGAAALPQTVMGTPTPMVLFIGLSVAILSMLRTT